MRQKGSGDPLQALKKITRPYRCLEPAPLPFAGGAAGLFAYELKNRIERFRLPAADPWKLPDVDLGFYDRGLVLDHRKGGAFAFRWFSGRETRLAGYAECRAEAESVFEKYAGKKFEADRPSEAYAQLRDGAARRLSHEKMSAGFFVRLLGRPGAGRERFVRSVQKIQEQIRRGNVYQVNLSQLLEFEFSGDPYRIYLRQARMNPTAFSAYADLGERPGEYAIVSASPERLVRVEGGRVSTRPIAGTRPRSADSARDRALTSELLLSLKERAEHVMLVDLERNDLGRVCRPGSVKVDELMAVEAYSHVKHIVSNVVGELAPDKDVWDVIRAVFPGGTITGAPKIRAMEWIDRLERRVRGPYTGSLGYVGFDGNCDLNIVIRTLWTRRGRAYLQAGAGIVADSDPQKEYEETLHKAGAFLDVLGLGQIHATNASA